MGKRKTIRITANELLEGNVRFISLVQRGANRIPFRILKEDNVMKSKLNNVLSLDLGRLFVKEDAAPLALQAIAVVSAKADDVAQKLESHDIKVLGKHDVEESGVTLLQIEENMELEDVMTLKADENTALLVSGSTLKKGFSSYVYNDEATFKDAAGAAGFFPSLNAAMNVFAEKVYDVMGDADDNTSAAKSLGGLVDEFGMYVKELVGGLPTVAFKAYDVLTGKADAAQAPEANAGEEEDKPEVADPAEQTKAKAEDTPGDGEEDTDTDPNGGKDAAAKETDDGEPEQPEKGTTADDGGEPEGKQKADAQEDPVLKGIADTLRGLTELVQKQDERIGSLSEQVSSMGEAVERSKTDTDSKLASFEERTQSALEAVNGITLGDGDAPDVSRKSEQDAVAQGGVELPQSMEIA